MGITSTGIGSGLKVEDIITQLVALEKRPITTLQAKAANIQTRLTTVGTIKSQVSALYDAAFNLSLDRGWSGSTITSSQSSAVTGSITGAAKSGSFSVSVSKLAQAQSATSAVVSPTTGIGTGTLKIDLGTWTPVPSSTTSTFASTGSVNVTISAANNSLTGIAAAINDAGAGVTATVLTDASGQRLAITSNTTGKASGFRITATDTGNTPVTDGSGISQFGFDLEAAVPYGMAVNSYQKAQNALATINGAAVESASNTFKDGVPGITLDFTAETTTPAIIKVVADKTAIKANIQAFADAYNAVMSTVSDATKYDAQTKTAGVLQGDTMVNNLKNALRQITMSSSTGSTFARLNEIGLDLDTTGKMTVNDSKLTVAMTDLDNLKRLFSQDNSNSATNGIARKVKDFAKGILASDGAVTTKTDALQVSVTRNTAEQDKVTARAAATEARLRKQYTALDVQMGNLNALNSYITQQISVWNNSNSKN